MKHRLALTALFLAAATAGGKCAASPVHGQGSWETTLQARDVDGDGKADAFYDTLIDITWAASWGQKTNVTQSEAKAWASTLSVAGATGWRLPTFKYPNATCFNWGQGGGLPCGYNVDPTYSELLSMYYVTLGNHALCEPGPVDVCITSSVYGLTNTALFSDMIAGKYWTGSSGAGGRRSAGDWYLDFGTFGSPGVMLSAGPGELMNAVAIHDGDIFQSAAQTIPEPSSLALSGIALAIGLGAARLGRKERR